MKDIVDYSKKSQANDDWARVKNWKPPAKDGRGEAGNTDLGYSGKNKSAPVGKNKPGDSQV